jgi:hypothetical protein
MVSLPKKSVKHYITHQPIYVNVNSTIQEAARILVSNNIHGAPVEDNGKMVGVVTFTDIGEALASGKMTLKVKDIMTRDLITINGNSSLSDAVQMFNKYDIGRLVVTLNDEPAGLLSKTDVLHELAVY